MKGHRISCDLIVAGAIAVTLAVILPFQTYWANSTLYAFSLTRLAIECGIAAVGLFLAVSVVLVGVDRFLGGFLKVAFTAFLVCVYLESGPLAFGLPEINGTQIPELASLKRMAVDGAVLCVVFLALVACFRHVRGVAHWIALGALVMSLASTFDVGSDKNRAAGKDASSGNLHPQVAVLQSVRYSPVRNVLVFIVDSMTAPMCAEIMRGDAELRAAYPGFTAYENVGMADCTKRGIPGIMTGKYFGPDSSSAEYPMTSYGEDSLLAPYLAADCPVYFVPDLMPYGCTNRKIGETPKPKGRQKRNWSVLMRRSLDVPFLSVLDVVLFRTLPFAFKGEFVYTKIRHDPMVERDTSNFWHDHVMFPRLAKMPVSDEPKTALGVFHTWGAHMPRYFDDEGRPLSRPVNDAQAVLDASHGALRHLGRLMKALQARGLYDKSTVVVCADHGNGNLPPPLPGRKSEERALLWVKPEGATAPFAISDVPTSTSKIAPLVKASLERPLTQAEVEAIVTTERRRFSGLWRKKFNLLHCGVVFREWIIGRKGEVLETSEWEN